MHAIRVLIAAIIAALALFAASASARNLSTTASSWRATFREVRLSGGFGTIVCPVTLESSSHSRSIAKVMGALIGYYTKWDFLTGGCTQGGATVLRETFPWHKQYCGFFGTLPNVAAVCEQIVGYSIATTEPVFGITCLWRSTAESPVRATMNREAGGRATTVTLSGTVPTSCGISGTVSGTSNSLTALTITLI